MRKSITKIIGDIVGAIDKTIKIDSFNQDATTVTIYVCTFKWLKVGSVISDTLGNQATVTVIDIDFIVAEKIGTYTWTGKVLTINTTFHYIFGTRMSVNAEWLQLSSVEDNKLPLFCLVMPTRETNEGFQSGLDRESSIVLYVLNYCNWSQTDQLIQDEVIYYLWLYVEAFLETIKLNQDFPPIESTNTRELHRFGTESTEGFESEIFDSNLSAIELRFTLPIRKGAKICIC